MLEARNDVELVPVSTNRATNASAGPRRSAQSQRFSALPSSFQRRAWLTFDRSVAAIGALLAVAALSIVCIARYIYHSERFPPNAESSTKSKVLSATDLNKRFNCAIDSKMSSVICGLMIVETHYATAPKLNKHKEKRQVVAQGFTLLHKSLVEAATKSDPKKELDSTRLKTYMAWRKKRGRPHGFSWFYFFLGPEKIRPSDVLCAFARDGWTNRRVYNGCGALWKGFPEPPPSPVGHPKMPIILDLKKFAKLRTADPIEKKTIKAEKYLQKLRRFYKKRGNVSESYFDVAESELYRNLDLEARAKDNNDGGPPMLAYWGPHSDAQLLNGTYFCNDLVPSEGPFAKNEKDEYFWQQEQCRNAMIVVPSDDRNFKESEEKFVKSTCGTSFCAWKGTELEQMLELSSLMMASGTQAESFRMTEGKFLESLYSEVLVPFEKYTASISGLLVKKATLELSAKSFPSIEHAKEALQLDRTPTPADYASARQNVLATLLTARRAVAHEVLQIKEEQLPIFVIDLDHEGDSPLQELSSEEQALLSDAAKLVPMARNPYAPAIEK